MPKFTVELRRESRFVVEGESKEEIRTFFDDLSSGDLEEWMDDYPDTSASVWQSETKEEPEFKMYDGKCLNLSDIPHVVPDLGLAWLKELTIKGDRFNKAFRVPTIDGPRLCWTNGHWMILGPDADVPADQLDVMDAKTVDAIAAYHRQAVTSPRRAEFLRERLRAESVLDGRLIIGPGHFDSKYLREAARRCDGETLRVAPLEGAGSHFRAGPEYDPIMIMGDTVMVIIMPVMAGDTPGRKFCEWSKT